MLPLAIFPMTAGCRLPFCYHDVYGKLFIGGCIVATLVILI